jgi:hypothetical protein
VSYDIQLVAYSPGTDTVLGVLPEPLSWSASVVLNNDGALTVKYSELAENGDLAARGLNAGLDIALKVNWQGGPTDWVEPDGCRYLLVGDDYDKSDPALVHTLTLPSWSWLLNKICDLNTGALAGSKSKNAGMRVFSATSDAGDVCKKMLDEHDARSGPAVPILRDSWTTTKDSGGNNWAKKLGKATDGRAFPAGQPLHEKLDALTKNGLCDWITRGRGLRIYNPNTASADLSATVHLRYGDDLTDAPSSTSQADRVARLLVKGDGKHKVTVKDPSVPEYYGRWEGMIDSAGVKNDDDLEDAGNAALDDRNRIKGQYVRTLTMAGTWLPIRDYNVGDWITAPGATGDERLRIMQITITRDEQNGLSGNIVLGDRFTNADLALAGRVTAITAGSTGVIGNGSMIGAPIVDSRQPAAPTNLTVTGELYVNPFGEHRVRGRFSWDPVSTATDGTELDVSRYELLGQPQTTPASEWRTIGATSSNAAALTVDEFQVGSQWLFTARAYGVTTTEPGVQSATASIEFGTDAIPPNKPSTPTGGTWLGAGVVGWDGKDTAGDAMPPDFARCEVHLSTTSGFTPDLTGTTTRRAALLKSGTFTVSGLAYGTTYYVRLVAYDLSGNASVPSDQVSFTPARVKTSDLVDSYTVTFTDTPLPPYKLGDLWQDSDSILWICTTARGTGAFVASDWSLQIVTAEMMAATDIFSINQTWGPPSGTHLSADADDGFQAWAPNPAASNAVQSWLRMGDADSGDGMSFGFDPDNPVARITASGNASFQSVSTQALRVGGSTLDEILAPYPRGTLAYTLGTTTTTGITTTETGVIELRAVLQPDRLYKIEVSGLAVRASAADTVALASMRYAYDGSAVSTSSTILRNGRLLLNPTNVYTTQPAMSAIINTAGQGGLRELRALLSIVRDSGGTIDVWGSATQPVLLEITDQGAAKAATTTAKLWTSVWNCSAMHANGAGSPVTSVDLIAAQNPGTYAQWAHLLFGNAAISGESATVAAALAGATLLKAELGAYYSKASTSWAVLGWPQTTTAANSTAPSGLTGDQIADSASSAAPAQVWGTLASFTTTSRSVKIGNRVIGGNYVRTLNTASHPLQLRLTYLR